LVDPPGESDRELVERMKAGDGAAFEVFYRRHRDWIVATAHRFSGNQEDALDVLQETFAYFLRALPGLELTSQARTFLYPAVKHLALSRRKASRKRASLDEVPDPPARPEEPDEIGEVVRSLPEAEREVVLLRFADGLDLRSIAEALSIPLGTVKSRLHNALERLRRRRTP
jgi:RNA polymerase sigma-70 factor, ECF subfamily